MSDFDLSNIPIPEGNGSGPQGVAQNAYWAKAQEQLARLQPVAPPPPPQPQPPMLMPMPSYVPANYGSAYIPGVSRAVSFFWIFCWILERECVKEERADENGDFLLLFD